MQAEGSKPGNDYCSPTVPAGAAFGNGVNVSDAAHECTAHASPRVVFYCQLPTGHFSRQYF
jgi:hypothetical protein